MRVIFDPVTYVVFNGIGAGRLREIVLLAGPTESSAAELPAESDWERGQKGNFELLRNATAASSRLLKNRQKRAQIFDLILV